MTPDANLIQVEIFGQNYTLRAEGDAEYVRSLAAYVDGKMREVATQTRAVDSLRVAILAALNIADERHRGATPPQAAARGAAASGTQGETRQERAAPRGSPAGAGADLDRRAAEWERLLDQALAG